MIRTVKTEQASEILCIEKHLFKALRETGLLIGRKVGHGYGYDTDELDALQIASRGFDLSSDDAIRFNAPMILRKLKSTR